MAGSTTSHSDDGASIVLALGGGSWPSLGSDAAWVPLLVLAVVFPGLFTGRDPLASDMAHALAAPSLDHVFGTDHLGRDVWSRVVHGARYSILIGVASTAIAVLLGVLFGLIAGLVARLLFPKVD